MTRSHHAPRPPVPAIVQRRGSLVHRAVVSDLRKARERLAHALSALPDGDPAMPQIGRALTAIMGALTAGSEEAAGPEVSPCSR